MIDSAPLVDLTIRTRRPSTYELHDTETGQVWVPREGRWVPKPKPDVWLDFERKGERDE